MCEPILTYLLSSLLAGTRRPARCRRRRGAHGSRRVQRPRPSAMVRRRPGLTASQRGRGRGRAVGEPGPGATPAARALAPASLPRLLAPSTLTRHTGTRSSAAQQLARPLQRGRLHTHTHTQPFNGLWSGTTRVGRYQKKHSPTHTHPDHRTSFIILHLQRSMASSLFISRA